MTTSSNTKHTERIVILGGGFGGAYCAQALEKRRRHLDAEVLMLDRNNYFVFDPLLVEAGTGSLEPRHSLVALRHFLSSTAFHTAEVLGVDTEAQQVIYQIVGRDYVSRASYDHLVFALGSVTLLPDIPGLHEYGFTMKHLADAMRLRDRAIYMLELADATPEPERRRALLHFVVVGGSFTGVEVAGQYLMYLRQACRQYRTLRPEECTVTLIQRGKHLLPVFDSDLADYATAQLQRQGVQVRLQTTATEVRHDQLHLNNGETLQTHTVIWCAGIQPNPLVQHLPFPVDDKGYILCERDLRVQGFDNIWAIGDSAVNPDAEGIPYPATAQHAVRQAAHLARNLERVLRHEPSQPCDIQSPGQLAALGNYKGVGKVKGWKFSGFFAWFLWRTVYLVKMPGWSRSIRVALDWTLELFFSKDYVPLGVVSSRQGHASDK